jgi:hypothetical protein
METRSPLGIEKMGLYRKRMAELVKEGTLTRDEAEVLVAREMRRIIDRLV